MTCVFDLYGGRALSEYTKTGIDGMKSRNS